MMNHVAKRYACDRCREQKLRCARSQRGSSCCDRCLRLGVLCVTSSGRPLGRPPANIHDPDRGPAQGPRSQFRDQRARIPRGRGLSASTASNPLLSPRSQVAAPDGSDSTAFFPHSPTQFDSMYDMMDDCEVLDVFPGHTDREFEHEGTRVQIPEPFAGALNLDLGGLGDLTAPPTKGMKSSSLDSETGGFQQSDSPVSDSLVSRVPAEFHVAIIGNISRQLGELKGQPLEAWDRYLTRAPQNGGADLECTINGRNEQNLWDSVLSVVMRLVLVLQTMLPPQTPCPAPYAYSPPAFSTVLMLLSTYIQLGELFNTVLGHIRHHLQQTLRLVDITSLATSGATLKQLPRHPASFQVTMMVQFFENQSNSVEHMMGLPQHCRVWNRKDSSAGILDQDESFICNEAVMRQAQEPFRSLKRAIENVKVSLRLSLPSSQTASGV